MINKINNTKDVIKYSKKLKGKTYELLIGFLYEVGGYEVSYHGIQNNYKDRGIDLIASKNNLVIFIQCKNWNEKNREKFNIKETDIEKFEKKVEEYINKNKKYQNKQIQKRYIISGDLLDDSAFKAIRDKDDYDFEIIREK